MVVELSRGLKSRFYMILIEFKIWFFFLHFFFELQTRMVCFNEGVLEIYFWLDFFTILL